MPAIFQTQIRYCPRTLLSECEPLQDGAESRRELDARNFSLEKENGVGVYRRPKRELQDVVNDQTAAYENNTD